MIKKIKELYKTQRKPMVMVTVSSLAAGYMTGCVHEKFSFSRQAGEQILANVNGAFGGFPRGQKEDNSSIREVVKDALKQYFDQGERDRISKAVRQELLSMEPEKASSTLPEGTTHDQLDKGEDDEKMTTPLSKESVGEHPEKAKDPFDFSDVFKKNDH